MKKPVVEVPNYYCLIPGDFFFCLWTQARWLSIYMLGLLWVLAVANLVNLLQEKELICQASWQLTNSENLTAFN